MKNFARLHADASRHRPHRHLSARPRSIRPSRSRRPSARSRSWSRPDTCATSACRRPAPDTIRRAHAVAPVTDLQIEYSLISRGIEEEILPIAGSSASAHAYGVLSRGLISGHWSTDRARARAISGACPRFSGENLDRNLGWSRSCGRWRTRRARPSRSSPSRGCSPAARTSCRSSAPGAATGSQEALGALELELTSRRCSRDRARGAAGGRGRRPLRRAADGDPRQRAPPRLSSRAPGTPRGSRALRQGRAEAPSWSSGCSPPFF